MTMGGWGYRSPQPYLESGERYSTKEFDGMLVARCGSYTRTRARESLAVYANMTEQFGILCLKGWASKVESKLVGWQLKDTRKKK